ARRTVADGVQPAPLSDDERRSRGEQGADPRPRVELRLRRRRTDRRVIRVLPAPKDRQDRSGSDPHGARRRVRVAAAATWRGAMARLRAALRIRSRVRLHVRPWREWTVRTRLVASIAVLAAIALIVASSAGVLLIRSYLIGRVDAQLTAQARAD